MKTEQQKKIINAVSAISKKIRALFGNAIEEKSIWEWLSFLRNDIVGLQFARRVYDIETAFYYSLIGFIDVNLLGNVSKELEKGGDSTTHSDALLKNMEMLAAAFLYYTPDDTPASVEELRKAKLWQKDGNIIKYPPSLMRALGQGFFAGDSQMTTEAFNILENLGLDLSNVTDKNSRILLAVLLFSAFSGFNLLPKEKQLKLVGQYIWWIIDFELPIRYILKNVLSNESTMNDYVLLSGSFAELILANVQPLFNGDLTVSQFLKGYFDFAKGDDLEEKKMENFVGEQIKKNNWPQDGAEKLMNLLLLYLHLRECDLTDYRGLLSDEKAIKEEYDFAGIIKKDLSDVQKEELERYLRNIHRPFKMRMEAIVAFQGVNWSKEPYLSRVLAISDIYEKVYGPYYGPLVFFDEAKSKWILNNEVPRNVVERTNAVMSRTKTPII